MFKREVSCVEARARQCSEHLRPIGGSGGQQGLHTGSDVIQVSTASLEDTEGFNVRRLWVLNPFQPGIQILKWPDEPGLVELIFSTAGGLSTGVTCSLSPWDPGQ